MDKSRRRFLAKLLALPVAAPAVAALAKKLDVEKVNVKDIHTEEVKDDEMAELQKQGRLLTTRVCGGTGDLGKKFMWVYEPALDGDHSREGKWVPYESEVVEDSPKEDKIHTLHPDGDPPLAKMVGQGWWNDDLERWEDSPDAP